MVFPNLRPIMMDTQEPSSDGNETQQSGQEPWCNRNETSEASQIFALLWCVSGAITWWKRDPAVGSGTMIRWHATSEASRIFGVLCWVLKNHDLIEQTISQIKPANGLPESSPYYDWYSGTIIGWKWNPAVRSGTWSNRKWTQRSFPNLRSIMMCVRCHHLIEMKNPTVWSGTMIR